MKLKREKLKFHLDTMNPDAIKVIDGPNGGKFGAAIVVPNNHQVVSQGVKGDGTFAWVQIQIEVGELNIGSLYAPNERVKRTTLWKWLAVNLEGDQWILNGDWNMIDLYDDAIGPSDFIHNLEARAWNRLVYKMDLVDNLLHMCKNQAWPSLYKASS